MFILHPILVLIGFMGGTYYTIKFIFDKKFRTTCCAESYILVIFITVAYYTALYSVTAAFPRYSIPLRPELYIWVIFIIFASINAMRQSNGTKILKNRKDNE